MDVVIGRPEIDAWSIIFTAEGPKPLKVPNRVRSNITVSILKEELYHDGLRKDKPAS